MHYYPDKGYASWIKHVFQMYISQIYKVLNVNDKDDFSLINYIDAINNLYFFRPTNDIYVNMVWWALQSHINFVIDGATPGCEHSN